MNTDRPLDGIASIKVKLGLLVAVSVVVAILVAEIGNAAGVDLWVSVPVTVAAALGVTQWLARGMTSPLRAMTAAARAMAGGDYRQRVTASSSDEVGELGRAFNAMAADLADADVQRRRLVATVSHELRTPLTAQRALLENLVDGVVTPDDDSLRSALAQAERLSELVGDLLDLSRVDAGVAPLRLGAVGVADLLARAAGEAGVQGRPVTVTHAVEPADLSVVGDAGRLAQLVANLVDNAVRHSPAGGTVRLTARAVAPGPGDPARWVLEVADDGPGIPAERADRVFERFGSGDTAGGGTGLGLAIARWVAELHGGTVEVVPTPSGRTGALLRATLPTRPRAERPTHLREEPSVPTTTPTPPTSPTPPAAPAPVPPAAAAPVPPPPGGPSLVGELWPERGLGPVPRTVLAALGVGAFAAVTWPFREVGLETSLTMLLAGGLMWVVARHRRDPWTLACAVLAALLATTAALRDSQAVVTLAVLAGVTVAAAGVTRARGLLAMVAAGAAWPLSGLRGLPLLGRTLTAVGRRKLLWPVLRTAALALVALVVFGGLFASGDAVFGSWASALVPDLGWDSIILRTFVLVLVAGVTLAGAYLALNPPEVDRVRLPDAARTSRPWEWAVPLAVVVALFAAFLLAQASEMWGGLAYLRRTTGLTYAEYVHQGFGQLSVATFLTIVVVAVTLRIAPRSTPRERLVLRVLPATLCVLTLAVVASALYRMSLYQDAYGYTVLRVFVDGVELWFGLVVVLLLVAVLRLSTGWVPRAVLVSGAVFVLGFSVLNPDAFVAARNADRYAASGRVDAVYLGSLTADATPVVLDRFPGPLGRCIVDRMSTGAGERTDDWVSWNLGRARARAALEAHPGPVGDCTPYLVDDYRR